MGYYSTFKITLKDESFSDAFILALTELEAVKGYAQYLESGYSTTFTMGEGTKWYDFNRDMDAVAAALPQVDFDTERLGEDGEGERRYYRNGIVTHEQKRSWGTV
jgi:dTDP-glucose pyrophosphorylase